MKNKIIAFLCSLFMIFSISGCSFTADETLEISTLTTKLLDDGTTMVMITYTDETKDEFKIPKGVEGNGIKEIKTTKNDKGNITTVTVIYTDETIEPVTFDVKDGVSITGVISRTNEETGEIYLRSGL